MNVQRVDDPTGSHIEPALEDDWTDLEKLRWKAAILEMDTGLKLEIRAYPPMPPYSRETFGLNLPGSSTGGYTFDRAWTYINGMSQGAEHVNRPRWQDVEAAGSPLFDHLIDEWWPVLRETISSLLPGPKITRDHPYDSYVRKLWAAS